MDKSSIQAAMDYIASEAPGDVLLTMTWLQVSGWHPIAARVWKEAFGNADAEFRKANVEVQIVRDRGQWMLSLRFTDWKEWFDFGLVLDAKIGRTEWNASADNPYVIEQLPAAVSWADNLPDAIEWIITSENMESKLNELKAERFRQRFP